VDAKEQREMSVACQTITWGGVVGYPAGVTTIKDLWYLAYGPDDVAIREVAEAGYDGVELFDGNLQRFANSAQKLERLLQDTGLELLAVYSGANFIYPDVRDDEFFRLEEAAKLGHRFGARYFTVGGGAIRAAGIRDDDFEALARGLDRVVEIGRRHGLQATYHPHLGTISQDPDGLHRLLKLTDIRLCLDTGHIAAGGGDPVEIVRTYRQRTPCIHFKDYADGRFLPLGEGGIDLKGVAAVLGGTHENGWWTVELDETDRPPVEVAKQNRRAIDQLVSAHAK
jgi:inosose dehydratase